MNGNDHLVYRQDFINKVREKTRSLHAMPLGGNKEIEMEERRAGKEPAKPTIQVNTGDETQARTPRNLTQDQKDVPNSKTLRTSIRLTFHAVLTNGVT